MLKNIPPILSPALLKVLCEMGHGDRICIGDGNFPAASVGEDAVVLRADGHGVPALLDAILTLFPLDTYVDRPVTLMELTEHDAQQGRPPVWKVFSNIIARHDPRGEHAVDFLPRFEYYDFAKTSYCVLASGETALYANIILQKGVI